MAMKELYSKFLGLLHCVPYIIDEKPKIQWFLSFFPIMFKERIEYDDLKMLEEAMRKENFCYDQNKNKWENIPAWKNKMTNNFDPRNKKNKFRKNIGNNYRGYHGNNYKGFKPDNYAVKEPSIFLNKNP